MRIRVDVLCGVLVVTAVASVAAISHNEQQARRRGAQARDSFWETSAHLDRTSQIDEWVQRVRTVDGAATDELQGALVSYPGEDAVHAFRVAAQCRWLGDTRFLERQPGYDPYTDAVRLRQLGRVVTEQGDPLLVLSVGRHLANGGSVTAYTLGVSLQCEALASLHTTHPPDLVQNMINELDAEQRNVLTGRGYMQDMSLDGLGMRELTAIAKDDTSRPVLRSAAITILSGAPQAASSDSAALFVPSSCAMWNRIPG